MTTMGARGRTHRMLWLCWVTLAVAVLLALAPLRAVAADRDPVETSPPCSDPEGVVVNLFSQVVRMAQTREGRAALGPLIGTTGSIIATYVPHPAGKAAALTITGALNALVAGSNAAGAHRDLDQSTRTMMHSLTPQQRVVLASQLSRHFTQMVIPGPGGICLEEPRFRVAPDLKERFERAREAAQ